MHACFLSVPFISGSLVSMNSKKKTFGRKETPERLEKLLDDDSEEDATDIDYLEYDIQGGHSS